MRNLHDIEARLAEINEQIDMVPRVMQEICQDPDAISELAENFALLLHERRVLEFNILHSRRITESLVSAKCEGAH